MLNVDECNTELTDVFSKPGFETSVKATKTHVYYPISKLDSNGPFEFNLPPLGNSMTRPCTLKLFGRFHVIHKDGTKLELTEEISMVNLASHSLFKTVEYQLGDTVISDSSGLYPYRAYLETLLSYNREAKKGHLRSGLWLKDTSKDSSNNTGYYKRMEWFEESKTVEFCIDVHLDTNHQCKLFPGTLPEKIKFIRTSDQFVLWGEKDIYNIVITDLALMVDKVTLHESAWVNMQKMLLKLPARYQIPRVLMKAYTIPKGNMSASLHNIFTTQMPRQVLIGLVDTEAFHGNIKKNPFHFHHYNISNLQFTMNGESFPSQPFKPQFDKKLYMHSYLSLFDGTGLSSENAGLDITYDDYINGHCLFVVDLTPDRCGGTHIHAKESGVLSCEIIFAKALPDTVNIIVYGAFENEICVDHNNNVTTDFQI